MHLRQLELGLRPGSGRKSQVADDVSEGLSVMANRSARHCGSQLDLREWYRSSGKLCRCWGVMSGEDGDLPFWFVFCEDLSLGVVADDFDVDEAAQVELLRSEH